MTTKGAKIWHGAKKPFPDSYMLGDSGYKVRIFFFLILVICCSIAAMFVKGPLGVLWGSVACSVYTANCMAAVELGAHVLQLVLYSDLLTEIQG